MPDEPMESADAAPRRDPATLELKPLIPDMVDMVDPDEISVGAKTRPNATSSGWC